MFIATLDSSRDECGEDLGGRARIMLNKDKGALFLLCAGPAHLVLLPSGDAALTRVPNESEGKYRLPDKVFGLRYRSPSFDNILTVRFTHGDSLWPFQKHYLKVYSGFVRLHRKKRKEPILKWGKKVKIRSLMITRS
jgi:hypothetical protein